MRQLRGKVGRRIELSAHVNLIQRLIYAWASTPVLLTYGHITVVEEGNNLSVYTTKLFEKPALDTKIGLYVFCGP
jgi:hypothetical protein